MTQATALHTALYISSCACQTHTDLLGYLTVKQDALVLFPDSCDVQPNSNDGFASPDSRSAKETSSWTICSWPRVCRGIVHFWKDTIPVTKKKKKEKKACCYICRSLHCGIVVLFIEEFNLESHFIVYFKCNIDFHFWWCFWSKSSCL